MRERSKPVQKMPNSKEMVMRLKWADVLGMSELSDSICSDFVDRVAGTEQTGIALAFAWGSSLHKGLEGYDSELEEVLNMFFDNVIDAVTLDQAVARNAKNFMREALEQTK